MPPLRLIHIWGVIPGFTWVLESSVCCSDGLTMFLLPWLRIITDVKLLKTAKMNWCWWTERKSHNCPSCRKHRGGGISHSIKPEFWKNWQSKTLSGLTYVKFLCKSLNVFNCDFTNTICWVPMKSWSYVRLRPTDSVCVSANVIAAVQT